MGPTIQPRRIDVCRQHRTRPNPSVVRPSLATFWTTPCLGLRARFSEPRLEGPKWSWPSRHIHVRFPIPPRRPHKGPLCSLPTARTRRLPKSILMNPFAWMLWTLDFLIWSLLGSAMGRLRELRGSRPASARRRTRRGRPELRSEVLELPVALFLGGVVSRQAEGVKHRRSTAAARC